MSMSTYIQAFIPDTDQEYQKHKNILLMCADAKVDLPKQTAEYFDNEYPEKYLLEEKLEIDLKKGIHYVEYNSEMNVGFEVDLNTLPSTVTKLRFINSY